MILEVIQAATHPADAGNRLDGHRVSKTVCVRSSRLGVILWRTVRGDRLPGGTKLRNDLSVWETPRMASELRSHRLVLRALQLEDAVHIAALLHEDRDAIRRMSHMPDPCTVEVAREWIAFRTAPGAATFAIMRAADGVFLGAIWFGGLPEMPGVGYWMPAVLGPRVCHRVASAHGRLRAQPGCARPASRNGSGQSCIRTRPGEVRFSGPGPRPARLSRPGRSRPGADPHSPFRNARRPRRLGLRRGIVVVGSFRRHDRERRGRPRTAEDAQVPKSPSGGPPSQPRRARTGASVFGTLASSAT